MALIVGRVTPTRKTSDTIMKIEILTRSQIMELINQNVLIIVAQEVRKAVAESTRKLALSIPEKGAQILAPSDSIEELGLGVRASNLLWNANIGTIEQLAAKTEFQLRCIRAMGSHTIMNIKTRLALNGYSLSDKNSNAEDDAA